MADRTVVTRLRLNVQGFHEGAQKASADLTGLNKKMVETAGFAKGMRKTLEDATKRLPKIEIDADTKPAEVAIAGIRERLATLAGKTIGVDINASAAFIEMEALQKELEAVEPDVSFEIRADVAGALADIQKVVREAQRVDGTTVNVDIDVRGGAFAQKVRAQVEAAARALPKIPIDADSTPAQRQIQDLRLRLEALSDKTVGIDVDAATALAEVAAVQAELDRLNRQAVTLDVDVDTATASAELAAINAEADRIDGKTAQVNVTADVSAALTALSAVAAALASIPSAASIAVGVAGLGAAFGAAAAGAAGFAAAVVPGLGRINEALKQQEQAAGRAGGATRTAGQSAAQAASQALQLEQAERRVTDAQKTVKDAQADLTQARRDARRALEDLTLSVKDAALAEEDAALSVEEARQRLAEVQADPKASDLERRRAELNYREAIQRLEDQRVHTKRLQQDKAAADKAGIEGSDQVKSAADKLAKAQQNLATSVQQLKVLQLQQKAAMQSAGGSAGGLASKFSQLSKSEKKLAGDIKDFKKTYEDWQKSLQPELLPVISKGLDLVGSNLDRVSPLAKAAGKGFSTLLDDAKGAIGDPIWDEWIGDLSDHIPGAIEGLGHTAGNVFKGIVGVVDAFLPEGDKLIDMLERGSEKFADWGTNLKGSPEFERFLSYANENGPKVVEIVENIAKFAGKVLEAGAGPGQGVLDFLVTLSEKLSSLSPEQIQAIAGGVGAVFAAMKLGQTVKLTALLGLVEVIDKLPPPAIYAIAGAIAALKTAAAVKDAFDAWSTLPGKIGKVEGAAGKASGKVGTLVSKLGGLSGVGVAGGVAAGGVAAAWGLDKLGQDLSGLNVQIGQIADGLRTLASGGQVGGDVKKFLEGDTGGIGSSLSGLAGGGQNVGAIQAAVDKSSNSFFTRQSSEGLLDVLFGSSNDESIKKMDKALAQLVNSGNGDQAKKLFDGLAKAVKDNGGNLDRLSGLFPEYTRVAGAAVLPTGSIGRAVGDAAKAVQDVADKISDFDGRLTAFNSKTDIARGALELKQAYDDTKTALDKTNGSLDLSKAKTDAQKLAVIEARDQFAGYIQKVSDLATAQGDLTHNSDDARNAVVKQLPQLFDLAGKSKEAKDQVYDLAQKFGITKGQADTAASGVKGVKKVLDELKSKSIDVKANTKPAETALANFKAMIKRDFGVIEIPVSIAAPKAKANGGITGFGLAQGGIVEAYAGGGTRGKRPAANITDSPVILYGEAGPEAFIPLDPGKRARGLEVLQQAAQIMGQDVVPAGAAGAGGWLDMLKAMGLVQAQASGGVTQSGSASTAVVGALSRNTTIISASLGDTARSVVFALGDTSTTLVGSLTSTSSTVASSLTTAGSSVTSALKEQTAGTVEATTGLASATTAASDAMAKQITALQKQVADLTKALAAAKDAAATASSAKSGTKSSSKAKPDVADVIKSMAGLLTGKAKTLTANLVEPVLSSTLIAPEATAPANPGAYHLSDLPGFAAGGIREPGFAAGPVLVGEGRAREAFIPYDPAMRTRAQGLASQVATDLGVSSTRTPTYTRSLPSTTYLRGGGAGSGGGMDLDRLAAR
ncbi:MAG TPA: hypothetical protein VIR33_10730, partial [Thermopolyspora sp.]